MEANIANELGKIVDLVTAIQSLEKTIQQNATAMSNNAKQQNKPKIFLPEIRTPKRLDNMNANDTPTKVKVFCKVVFLKIGEIDTLKENFQAHAYIQTRWREPKLDGQIHLDPEEVDWGNYWNPKVYVENNLGELKESLWYSLTFTPNGEAVVYEKRRVKGSFMENLELKEFPFDTQDLTITLATERSELEVDLDEDSSELCGINVQSFVDEQEWRLHSHIRTRKKVTTKVYQNSKYKHPAFSASCQAARRPGFFIWNIILVMIFISSLAFSTFAVDLMLTQNRLQLAFILTLAQITFKFVASQSLPRISYLTYLDKYILVSMAMLCAVSFWHAILALLKNNLPVARTADMAALIVLGSIYVCFHIIFFVTIYIKAHQRKHVDLARDLEHEVRYKNLQRNKGQIQGNYHNEYSYSFPRKTRKARTRKRRRRVESYENDVIE